MAAVGRRTDPLITEALFDRGFEFDFFQAVRLLRRLYPTRKPVGGAARPSDETVRFGAWLSLAFPASSIDFIDRPTDPGQPTRMTVTFLALTGIQGILPVFYTERLLAQKTSEESALADFLDLFNHRLVSLFYRAWEKHRFPVLYESAAIEGPSADLFTQSLFDLVGLGTNGLRGRMPVLDESLLRYAGLIAQRPHSASAVRSILRDFFGTRVEIDQCLGSWYELDEYDRAFLSPNLERNQLGVGAFIGDKVWDQQSRFRIRLGPIDFQRFQDFLPERSGISRMVALTRYLLGQALAFDVQLILRASEVPDARLTDAGPEAPRLGWSSWLKNSTFAQDAADAVFTYLT
jgi:type VI secretion system protein ImpH